MKCRVFTLVVFSFLVLRGVGRANEVAKPAHISKETRMTVMRGLNAELVYIRTPFPMGEKGLHLRKGELSPNGKEMETLLYAFGPAAKPGDRARISNVVIRDKSIIFEINGGPVKKKKWYQRVTVGGSGGETPIAPTDADANPRGSYLELQFEGYVPELTVPEIKALLRPAFDFDAKSAVEAYLETVPRNVKEAIRDHRVLVGMNREMVTYAKGRPPRKLREKQNDVEYEEWIYGQPPEDVEFVRLVGDEVIQMEIMKVGGEKILRTEKEVELAPAETVAQEAPAEGSTDAPKPTLRRPGEEPEPEVDGRSRTPRKPGPLSPPPADPNTPPPNFVSSL